MVQQVIEKKRVTKTLAINFLLSTEKKTHKALFQTINITVNFACMQQQQGIWDGFH